MGDDARAPALVRRSTAGAARVGGARTSRRIVLALGVWSLAYAGYRAYYAVGGRVGMFGDPVSEARFRAVNAAGALIIALAGIVPVLLLRVRALRGLLPVLGWVGAVGCCTHALVDMVLRVLSLTGVHPTELPSDFWRVYDRRASDLQDLLLNEPWFLVEGLLWGALGICLVTRSRRPVWVLTAVVATVVATGTGILSGLGIVGQVRVG